MYGLVDCNNFFVSCERIFRPDLNNKPVVVLSNNDGCIISRSNEAKRMGIPMGSPYFKIRHLIEKYDISVFSSNHILYGDISRRVMNLLSDFVSDMEIYSIDEAFIKFNGIEPDNLKNYAENIVKAIYKGVGIPVTIGIAPTKTLAKVATYFGKRYQGYKGVCIIDSENKRQKALMKLPISEVWGIGRRHSKTLIQYNINTAWDFICKDEKWIKKEFTITGVRTWKELYGINCIKHEDISEKKSICTSRSFAGKGIDEINRLEEIIANFASESAIKLRQQKSVCSNITVFARTSKFCPNTKFHQILENITLDIPTNDTAEIIKVTLERLRKHFISGCLYKKAGVILSGLSHESIVQSNLFDNMNRIKRKQFINTIDRINSINGKGTIIVASQNKDSNMAIKKEYCSRLYTTNIKDIIKVHS